MDGRIRKDDIVTVAVDTEPNTGFLGATTVGPDDGVVADEHVQSGIARIYAAGDVARAFDWIPTDRSRNRPCDSE